MQNPSPTLYLISGKIAAGKTTLAQKLSEAPATILISEDEWLSRLYPEEISSLEDYARSSARLRDVMGRHIQSILRAGLSVVMDYPANTLKQRAWMRGIFEGAGAAHELHYLDVPDEICKARLLKRNAEGKHEYQPTEADFDLFTSYFVPPTPDEGFNITVRQDR